MTVLRFVRAACRMRGSAAVGMATQSVPRPQSASFANPVCPAVAPIALPLDMPEPTSILTHQARAQERVRSRFRENVRQAGLLANAAEDEKIDGIVTQATRGEIEVAEALEAVLAIRRQQQKRAA